MRVPATVKWIGLALLGLAIAAAVAIAAGNLAGQQIGISSESLNAGEQLAPAVGGSRGGGKRQPGGETASTPTTPSEQGTTETTAPPTTPTAPSEPAEPETPSEPHDDSGGGGGGGGNGGGGGGHDD